MRILNVVTGGLEPSSENDFIPCASQVRNAKISCAQNYTHVINDEVRTGKTGKSFRLSQRQQQRIFVAGAVISSPCDYLLTPLPDALN